LRATGRAPGPEGSRPFALIVPESRRPSELGDIGFFRSVPERSKRHFGCERLPATAEKRDLRLYRATPRRGFDSRAELESRSLRAPQGFTVREIFYGMAASESVYLRLVEHCGWTQAAYARFLASALKGALL
jgi:hypothetical protein